MVRTWRATSTSGQLRYTASARSHENSRGSRWTHGRLSSAAADGHVYRARNATAFLQRVLERSPLAGSCRPLRLPARGRWTRSLLSRRRVSWPSTKERSKQRVVRECYRVASSTRKVRDIVDDYDDGDLLFNATRMVVPRWRKPSLRNNRRVSSYVGPDERVANDDNASLAQTWTRLIDLEPDDCRVL